VKDYEELSDLFSNHLKTYTAQLSRKEPKELYEPEAYILTLGGKRLRPLLALIACDLFNAEAKLALAPAMAVELFHNFSLVHDDILDRAPLRRGKPTVHHKWNVNRAILSGDVMLVKAFQLLADQKSALNQCQVLMKTAIEVCEGQQDDMSFEERENVTVSEYLGMIEKKTAVLLGCSLQLGGMSAGAAEEDLLHLYEFGRHIGIAFQLLDDLLDVFASDADKFGKQPGGDILTDKKTFLLLRCRELCTPEQQMALQNAVRLKEQEKVKAISELYKTLKVDQECRALAATHTNTALSHLEKVRANPEKIQRLKQFALALTERQI